MTPSLMIIDDSDVDRLVLSRVLTEQGYEIHPFRTARPALEALATVQPTLVLLDSLMPEMSGTEALTSIRARHSALELPVIMITSKSDSADVVESLRLGANDYITKPVDFAILLMRVRTQLLLAELSARAGQVKETAAVHALITTYNHEINNPLTIALGALTALIDAHPGDLTARKIEKALWRIADIVKMINSVTAKGSIETQEYTDKTKMLKISK